MPDERAERRFMLAMCALFALIALLAGGDLATDFDEGTTLLHVVVEGCVVAFGAGGVAVMARGLVTANRKARSFRREADDLALRLRSTQVEAERWRREAGDLLRGLGAAIDAQFARWCLTPAEREVGLLLLKGLSHREIAGVRQVGETTVRQQAQAVYRKAGVSGRHDLSAFFLEDLLLPQTTAGGVS